uniref:Putative p450 n=1 Tax=Ixodes ricinus TaxID=34613 RepID=A0A131XYE7_IXORI
MQEWLQLLFVVVGLCLSGGAVLVVGLLGALHVARLATWKHLKKVPGPNEDIPLRWVVLEHLRAEQRKPMVPYNASVLQTRFALCKLFQAHGICRFYLGTLPSVLIFKADFIETVMSNTLTKAPNYALLHSWLGTGLLTSTGPKWKKRRRMLTPAFHFRILDDFVHTINEHSRKMVAKISKLRQESEWLDVVPLSTSCTLGVLLETVMGVSASQEKECCEDYVKAINVLTDEISVRIQSPWLYPDFTFYRTDHGRRYKEGVAAVHAFSTKIIQKRRREMLDERKEASTTAPAEPGPPKKRLLTFLDILLNHSLDVDESFADEDIGEEVDTFMFAGHDTTAMAIAWNCYLIALHPDVQKKVQEELDMVLGELKTEDISTENLKELKYLECVVKESQRLCPSVPVIGRTVTKPFMLGNHVLPEGTSVEVFIYGLHRDPEVFPDPEVFDPDRFLLENCSSRHPFAFIPFSAGSRNCIGQRFGSMEVKITIAHIFKNFHVKPFDQRDKLLLSSELVLRSVNGLWLKFTHREV